MVFNLFGRDNKLEDCDEDPQTGVRHCRVGIKSKNSLLNTGTQFNFVIDQNTCKARLVDRNLILNDDEEAVNRALRRAEKNCRGGSSIN